MSTYEAVIGLEVHVQLATESKLFCSCPVSFGDTPNMNVCEVCSAMPGALPTINEKAVEYAALAGLATDCRVNLHSIFARKNYFYPDLPAGYQISQFDKPICEHGFLWIDSAGVPKKIGITRIHLENDAGKSIHAAGGVSFVDLNRAGTALIEVVSDPDMRSADEAVSYLKTLYGIVTWLGICDGNMEEGSFRCDANVSIRKKGESAFGVRAEIKNLNSFRHVQKAIEYEIDRHECALEDGEKLVQETRLYDSVKNVTVSMRTKEEAHDYRYFPDPDLLPIDIKEEDFSQWRGSLPELPLARQKRFVEQFGLSVADAETLTSERALADFFEQSLGKEKNHVKRAANLVMGPFLRALNARKHKASDSPMKPEALAALARLVDENRISATIAGDIFEDLYNSGADPENYVKEKGLLQISDSGDIELAVDGVLAANPAEVEAYRGGKTKLISFFVGQVMRVMKGKGNPAMINEILAKKLG